MIKKLISMSLVAALLVGMLGITIQPDGSVASIQIPEDYIDGWHDWAGNWHNYTAPHPATTKTYVIEAKIHSIYNFQVGNDAWDFVHEATSSQGMSNSGILNYTYVNSWRMNSNFLGNWVNISRTFLYFDMSVLPVDGRISSGYFRMNFTAGVDGSYLEVVPSVWGNINPHNPILYTDFDRSRYGHTYDQYHSILNYEYLAAHPSVNVILDTDTRLSMSSINNNTESDLSYDHFGFCLMMWFDYIDDGRVQDNWVRMDQNKTHGAINMIVNYTGGQSRPFDEYIPFQDTNFNNFANAGASEAGLMNESSGKVQSYKSASIDWGSGGTATYWNGTNGRNKSAAVTMNNYLEVDNGNFLTVAKPIGRTGCYFTSTAPAYVNDSEGRTVLYNPTDHAYNIYLRAAKLTFHIDNMVITNRSRMYLIQGHSWPMIDDANSFNLSKYGIDIPYHYNGTYAPENFLDGVVGKYTEATGTAGYRTIDIIYGNRMKPNNVNGTALSWSFLMISLDDLYYRGGIHGPDSGGQRWSGSGTPAITNMSLHLLVYKGVSVDGPLTPITPDVSGYSFLNGIILVGMTGVLGLILMMSAPYIMVKRYQNGDETGPSGAAMLFFCEILGLGLLMASIGVAGI